MPDLTPVWTILKEIDVSALRQQVQTPLRVAILSRDLHAARTLADRLLTSPFTGERERVPRAPWLYRLPLKGRQYEREVADADLAIIVLRSTNEDASKEDDIAAIRGLNPDLPMLAAHLFDSEEEALSQAPDRRWWPLSEVIVDLSQPLPLESDFIPALLKLLPHHLLPLGHHLPAMRAAAARKLISETSMSNATYVAGTGLAEMVPLLTVPLNVADLVVLTKNQVLLTYKLALLMGREGGLQEEVGPIAGVLGAGFLWRQVARTLVGLIPGFGIAPKIAVAYAGTYAVGHAALRWYAYGEEITNERLRALYAQALEEGKERLAAIKPQKRPALPRPSLRRSALPRPRRANSTPDEPIRDT
ncbi:MAG: hypothetical protein GXP42_07105 [Chloroflexi bacterium]|nr:hypothetical protein [Chloroflexota bacterium]